MQCETLCIVDPAANITKISLFEQAYDVILRTLAGILPRPKTESVKHTLGEPEPPKKNWFD